MVISNKLAGSMVYEVKHFSYAVGNVRYADIQILDFLDGFYGSQAVLLKVNENKKLSSGKPYESLEEALNDVIALIEEEIKDDQWVLDVKRSEAKVVR